MQYDEFISIITADVERILKENSVNIAKDLLSNIPQEQPCVSQEQLQICRNAVNLSVQMSVQIILDCLNSMGILKCENYKPHHEPPVLKVIQGGLSGKEKK